MMKTLCRTCHAKWCTARDEKGCIGRENQFYSAECEKCGKFIEIGIDCTHYDWRESRRPISLSTASTDPHR
jgi:hypothetical protein